MEVGKDGRLISRNPISRQLFIQEDWAGMKNQLRSKTSVTRWGGDGKALLGGIPSLGHLNTE